MVGSGEHGVQPHGAVLAVDEHDLAIAIASANAEAIVGIAHPHLLGATIGAVFGAAAERAIHAAIARSSPAICELETPAGAVTATVTRTHGLVAIELEPLAPAPDTPAWIAVTERLQRADRVPTLLELAARELRAAIDLERVAIYRFAAGTAEVVAHAGGEPSRALPAIHALAPGELVRHIADRAAGPVPLVRASPLADAPLDLHALALRHVAVPPGEGAALTLAIVVDGAPWGVIAADDPAPRAVPPRTRVFAADVARMLGWQLELRERIADELRTSNLAKDEWIATVSHELRTPLNAMLGWLRLIEAGQVAPERHPHAIATVTRNAHALAALVEELLDVSRIVSGTMRLELQPLAPATIVDAAVAIVQPAAEAKGIRIATMIDAGIGPVLADAQRLQQILWNLLTNAVKFTPERGRIEVALARTDGAVEIVVADSGIGIDAAFLPYVFDRFRQAPHTAGGSVKGLGLGLAIARHLVELHGGTVTAASDGAGTGARFTVRLPLAATRVTAAIAAPASPPVFEPAPQLRGLRVLVVDDERDANDLLHAVLSASGVEVTSVSSGAEVLAVLPALRPDVLISDIGMPGIDGYELIQQVRRLPRHDGGHTPAVAVTAFARSQDRARAFLAGFDVYLAKPIDPAELTALLVNLAGRRTGPVPRVDDKVVPRGELDGAKILVVEDDDDARELLCDLLQLHGATVEAVETAARAAAAVTSSRPDVVVCDLSLPDKDGYAFMRELRASGPDAGGWTPAIALSGHVAPDNVKQAILAGFQLHLPKPIDPKDLVDRLVRLVGRTTRRT